MKKLFFIIAPLCLLACNDSSTDTKSMPADSTSNNAATSGTTSTSTSTDYPYKIDHPDYWDINTNTNTMSALTALKSWENREMAKSVSYFADTVKLEFDGPTMTVTRDSLQKIFNADTSSFKSVQIVMEDWESVISKDKTMEWVTLWYKQVIEDKKGKIDSMRIVNDLQFDKNGKIKRLAEYKRKLK